MGSVIPFPKKKGFEIAFYPTRSERLGRFWASHTEWTSVGGRTLGGYFGPRWAYSAMYPCLSESMFNLRNEEYFALK